MLSKAGLLAAFSHNRYPYYAAYWGPLSCAQSFARAFCSMSFQGTCNREPCSLQALRSGQLPSDILVDGTGVQAKETDRMEEVRHRP